MTFRLVLELLPNLFNFRAIGTLIGQILATQIEWKESSSVRSLLRMGVPRYFLLRVGPRQLIFHAPTRKSTEKMINLNTHSSSHTYVCENNGTQLVSFSLERIQFFHSHESETKGEESWLTAYVCMNVLVNAKIV